MTAPLYIPRAIHAGRGVPLLDPGDAGTIYVDRCPCEVEMTSAGAETRTLGRPTKEGDIVTLVVQTYVGNITLTVTGGYNTNGDTTFTFSAAKQWAMFESAYDKTNDLYYWVMIANYALGNLSPTELGWLDGITPGTWQASKAAVLDSASTITGTAILGITPTKTVASAAAADLTGFKVSPVTITLTSTTEVTTTQGLVDIEQATLTDTMAVTVDGYASLYIANAPTAGGMVTITNAYALWVAAGVSRFDGNISLANQATNIVGKANTAAMVQVTDGTTALVSTDSRNTIKNVNNVTVTGVAPTIASETAAHVNASLKVAAKTLTYTGGTATTSSLGSQLYVAAPTFTDTSAMTITTVSSVHIETVAAAGGMLTITNSYMISTGVSDAYLSNAGVWHDTACFEYGKNGIVAATGAAIESLLDRLTPKTWRYKDDVHGYDFDRDRVGIVYDDLPGELLGPGRDRGVAVGVLASFALAAVKHLLDRNRDLEARLARLETP